MFAAMRATGKMKGKESAVHMAMIGKMAKGWKTKARAAKERRDGETRERGGERGREGEEVDGDYFGRRVYSLFALFRFVLLCFALLPSPFCCPCFSSCSLVNIILRGPQPSRKR